MRLSLTDHFLLLMHMPFPRPSVFTAKGPTSRLRLYPWLCSAGPSLLDDVQAPSACYLSVPPDPCGNVFLVARASPPSVPSPLVCIVR